MENNTQVNIYLGLIKECKQEIREIESKVSFVTTIIPEKVGQNNPERTELESELNSLLSMLHNLKDEIII